MIDFAANTQAGTLITTAIASYLCYIRRFTNSTQQHYRWVLRGFESYCPTVLEDLTHQHIEAYLNDLLINLCCRTHNNRLTVIKSFCRWASGFYEISNPAEKIHFIREDPPSRRVMSIDEYHRLLKVCTAGQRKLIMLIANTGLRAAEVKSLTEKNIIGLNIVIDGKGHRRRVIPINQVCQEILADINFLKNYRKRNAIYSMMQYRCRKAGIAPAGPHALRHMLAGVLAGQGVSLFKISKLLGHADTRTTEKIYINLTLESAVAGVTDNLHL